MPIPRKRKAYSPIIFVAEERLNTNTGIEIDRRINETTSGIL